MLDFFADADTYYCMMKEYSDIFLWLIHCFIKQANICKLLDKGLCTSLNFISKVKNVNLLIIELLPLCVYLLEYKHVWRILLWWFQREAYMTTNGILRAEQNRTHSCVYFKVLENTCTLMNWWRRHTLFKLHSYLISFFGVYEWMWVGLL